MSVPSIYTLAEVQALTGFPPGTKFKVVEEEPTPPEIRIHAQHGTVECPLCFGTTFYEWDRAERWNEMEITVNGDGHHTASVAQRDAEFETVGFICAHCHKEVSMPESVEITEWY